MGIMLPCIMLEHPELCGPGGHTEGSRKEDRASWAAPAPPAKNHMSLLGTQAQGRVLWGSDELEPRDGHLSMSRRTQWLLFTDGGTEAQEGCPAHTKYASTMQPALNPTTHLVLPGFRLWAGEGRVN